MERVASSAVVLAVTEVFRQNMDDCVRRLLYVGEGGASPALNDSILSNYHLLSTFISQALCQSSHALCNKGEMVSIL